MDGDSYCSIGAYGGTRLESRVNCVLPICYLYSWDDYVGDLLVQHFCDVQDITINI